MIVGGILPKVWICMEDCQLTKHVLMKLQKCLNSAQLKQKWIFQGSYDTLRYTFWVDRVLLRSVWKWGTPIFNQLWGGTTSRIVIIVIIIYYLLYLWNIWLKLPEVLLLDVFFQHFWPDQLLFLSVTRGEFHYSPIGMFIFTLILQAMRKTGSGRWKHVKSQRFVECAMWGPHDS